MKTYFTKHRILVWLIIILLIINISAIVTILFNNNIGRKYKDMRKFRGRIEQLPHQHVRSFIDSMKLDKEQLEHFRTAKHNFFLEAKDITSQMHDKRVAFINEIASENPDTLRIQKIAQEIGALHAKLKYQTYRHFIEMKSVCTKEQKKILTRHFKSMLYDDALHHKMKRPSKGKRIRYNSK